MALRDSAGYRAVGAICTATIALWAAWLLLAPTTGFHWIDSWHNEQRASQLLLLAVTALACCIGAWKAQQAWPRLSPLVWVLVAIGAVSASRAVLRDAAWAEVGHTFLLALLVLVGAAWFRTNSVQRFRAARRFAILVGSAYVIGVATRYAAALELDRSLDASVFLLGYANPRFPSALHAMLLPLLAATVVDRDERQPVRASALAVLVFLAAINLALGTRAIWLGCAAGAVAVGLLHGWRRVRGLLAALLVGVACGAVVYLLLFRFSGGAAIDGAPVASPMDNLTLTHRDILWKLSWEATVRAPLLGLGPMQFATIGGHYGAHPHNWVLQIASEWGLPALAVLIAAIGALAIRLWRARRDGNETAAAALAFDYAACSALAIGLVDGNLVMPVSQSAAALVLGACLATNRDEPPHTIRARLSSTATTLFALVAVVFVGAFARQSFDRLDEDTRRFRREHPGAWVVPRFWESGRLFVPPDRDTAMPARRMPIP